VFDAGPDPPARLVVVIADHSTGVLASVGDDRPDAAVSGVAEDDTTNA
jgi:hypothetical protein